MTTISATVLGAGSWGTALAKHLADQDFPVKLWSRRREHAEAIEGERTNATYLPGFTLPDNLHATSDLGKALEGASLVLFVVPSHGVRHLLADAGPLLTQDAKVLAAIKGIENDTLMLVSQIFEEILPPALHPNLTYLGGPSFAREVAQGIPTAVSVAGRDAATTRWVQHALASDRLRAYSTDDVVGLELGGALKNVVAIAAGIADGLGFGHNTRAALITRGLAEISRLAVKLGANPLTMAGLAGMGDLVLTCTGDLSRNRSVGLELGRGKKLADVLGNMRMVAEGVRTTRSAYELALREGVDMPIAGEIYAVLYEDKSPMEAVVSLMSRPQREERD